MNHTVGTSDAVGGSLCVSQPQQSGSPSNAATPPDLVWREITLQISVISDCFICFFQWCCSTGLAFNIS